MCKVESGKLGRGFKPCRNVEDVEHVGILPVLHGKFACTLLFLLFFVAKPCRACRHSTCSTCYPPLFEFFVAEAAEVASDSDCRRSAIASLGYPLALYEWVRSQRSQWLRSRPDCRRLPAFCLTLTFVGVAFARGDNRS